jgi:hypothetical protein
MRINWGERSSGLVTQNIALKDKKKLGTQINGKLNNIGSAEKINKKTSLSFKVCT